MGNRHSGLIGGGLLTPEGLGQQQDSQCKQPNEKESSDKSSPVGKKNRKGLRTKKACLYVYCQCHQSITTCMARERERKWRSNEMSLEEGTNH